MNQPNILFLTIDQHRWDFVTGGAVPGLVTPAMDRLRARGTTFTHAFSNCPICMPTRFTWMTGLYASQAARGLLDNAHDWPLDLPTLPQKLRESGYSTAHIGKLHRHAGLCRRDLGADSEETLRLGFDHLFEVSGKSLVLWFDCAWSRHLESRGLREAYRQDILNRGDEFGKALEGRPSILPEEDHVDERICREAERWLHAAPGDRPFYAHVSFCGPHFPIDPPERFHNQFAAATMPPAEGVDDPLQAARWKTRRAAYCALVAHVDELLGRVLNALDTAGLQDNTLVVFCSDHGEMIGHLDRPNKGTPYETSIRTPVTFVLPGRIPAGRVDPALLEAVDLPVTLAEAAGLAPAAELFPSTPGCSFWTKLIEPTTAPVRHFVYSEAFTGPGAWRLVRDQRYKFVARNAQGDLLFDLENDPWETVNLVEDPSAAGVRNRLQRLLIERLMNDCPAPNRRPCPPRSDWWGLENPRSLPDALSAKSPSVNQGDSHAP